MFAQTVWVVAILMATWFCFEGARFDRTPMRLLAFGAVMIGVLHGAHELHQLALSIQGLPIRRTYALELFLPFALSATKYFDIKRFIRVVTNG